CCVDTASTATSRLSLHDALPIFMLGGSFYDIPEFVADPLFWIPRDFTWDNYTVILREESFLRWFLNSVIITVVPVASQVFFCTLIGRSEEHTSELQSRENLVCRLLLEKKKVK